MLRSLPEIVTMTGPNDCRVLDVTLDDAPIIAEIARARREAKRSSTNSLADVLKAGPGEARQGRARRGQARQRRSSTNGLADVIKTKGGII